MGEALSRILHLCSRQKQGKYFRDHILVHIEIGTREVPEEGYQNNLVAL